MRFLQLVFENGIYLSLVKTNYFRFLLLILFLWTQFVFAGNKDTVIRTRIQYLGTDFIGLPDSSTGLSREYLLSITQQGRIVEFAYDNTAYLNQKYRPYTVVLHESQFVNGDEFDDMKYDGLLFAICDSGVFLSSRKMEFLRYYPYHTIQRIESGILTKRAIKRFVRFGGAVGLVGGSIVGSGGSAPINIAVVGVLGALAGSFYGAVLSVYYVVGKFIYNKLSITTSALISARFDKWMVFRKKTSDRGGYFKTIDISNFPIIDSALVPIPVQANPDSRDGVVTMVDSSSIPTVKAANADTAVSVVVENRGNQAADSIEKVTISQPVLPETKQTDWREFNLDKGLASSWMYAGYQTNAVRVAYLAKQFGWIRQRPVTAGDLAKLNTRSEIQFLAMWITTAAGYNFREVVSFNQEQLNFFQPKEPYLAEAVGPGSVIDPQVILDLDLENLKLLFEALQKIR